MQQTESQEKERKLAQEKADADVALQLLVEEKLRIAREDELKKVSEQVAKNMQLDEARLAEEVCSRWGCSTYLSKEERKRLVEKDLELAKKLAQEVCFSLSLRNNPTPALFLNSAKASSGISCFKTNSSDHSSGESPTGDLKRAQISSQQHRRPFQQRPSARRGYPQQSL